MHHTKMASLAHIQNWEQDTWEDRMASMDRHHGDSKCNIPFLAPNLPDPSTCLAITYDGHYISATTHYNLDTDTWTALGTYLCSGQTTCPLAIPRPTHLRCRTKDLRATPSTGLRYATGCSGDR